MSQEEDHHARHGWARVCEIEGAEPVTGFVLEGFVAPETERAG